MSADLIEINDFLGKHPPFCLLPEQVVVDAAGAIEISYCRYAGGCPAIAHRPYRFEGGAERRP